MANIFLDRIDAAPILTDVFEYPFASWLAVLVNVLNEDLSDIQNAFNLLTVSSAAILTETVTLTSGSPIFNVINGTLYMPGENVVGTGIPIGANILTIVGNVITLNANAATSTSSALAFIPVQGTMINGSLVYDTTNNVYVGMQNGALVKFTTSSYP